MKLLLTNSLILVSVFLSGCGKPSSDQWHEIDDGVMINLAHVTYAEGVIKRYSYYPLTSNGIEMAIGELEKLVSSGYEVSSYIRFRFNNYDLYETLYTFPATDSITSDDIDNIEDNLENALDYYQSIF